MPIYEYRCGKCQHKLEALQKFSDAPLSTCPACGEPALAKLVSAAGFQLKGSGWYQTDFRGNGGAKPDKSEGEKPAAAETPAKTESKSETSTAKSETPAATPTAPSSPTTSSTS
ncbi:MAG: zinc ribbon domain-containing protein [Burkholderiales bacterium]|nr:zinc ribbon domain-containing protein [Burkholderiales bacterium]